VQEGGFENEPDKFTNDPKNCSPRLQVNFLPFANPFLRRKEENDEDKKQQPEIERRNTRGSRGEVGGEV